jgi:uncharacterized protein (DUF983 family)
MLARAMLRRCPLCGRRGVFARWLVLAARCPGCAYPFDREEGYWVGAMIVNTGATQLVFFVWLLGGLLLTWPDVPWSLLLFGGIALMLTFPVLFYPWAKTLWLWLDFLLHPLATAERAGQASGTVEAPGTEHSEPGL